MRCGR